MASEQEEQETRDPLNIMRIEISIDDIPAMSSLVLGLIGMISGRCGGMLPPEITNALRLGGKVPSPQPEEKVVQQVPKPPSPVSVSVSTEGKHDLMDRFISIYCSYGEGLRIKSTEMRVKFNQCTGLNESHVSFARMMDKYVGESHIEKVNRGDGKWYSGIGWKQQAHVVIPPLQLQVQ